MNKWELLLKKIQIQKRQFSSRLEKYEESPTPHLSQNPYKEWKEEKDKNEELEMDATSTEGIDSLDDKLQAVLSGNDDTLPEDKEVHQHSAEGENVGREDAQNGVVGEEKKEDHDEAEETPEEEAAESPKQQAKEEREGTEQHETGKEDAQNDTVEERREFKEAEADARPHTPEDIEDKLQEEDKKKKTNKKEDKAEKSEDAPQLESKQTEEPQEDVPAEFVPSEYIFVSGDGDGIGATVEQKVLANDLEGIIRQSDTIKRGQAYIKQSMEDLGGKMLVHGGDDNLAVVPSKGMDKLEEIREGYHRKTGFTITFGIGNSMRDAVKALVYGKLTGKNKLVHWNDALNAELEDLSHEQTPQEKYESHGLLPEDVNKVDIDGDTTEARLERAKHADLITLPNNVKGTNCSNCLYIRLEDKFCKHKEVLQTVSERECCKYWDAEGAKREWEEHEKARSTKKE